MDWVWRLVGGPTLGLAGVRSVGKAGIGMGWDGWMETRDFFLASHRRIG